MLLPVRPLKIKSTCSEHHLAIQSRFDSSEILQTLFPYGNFTMAVFCYVLFVCTFILSFGAWCSKGRKARSERLNLPDPCEVALRGVYLAEM